MSTELIKVNNGELILTAKEAIIEIYKKEKEIKKLKDQLKKSMEKAVLEGGNDKYEDDDLLITWVYPTTKSSFNASKFKAENPELYAMYLEEGEVSGSVRVTLR